jgi:RNA polymerase primary sigma factor
VLIRASEFAQGENASLSLDLARDQEARGEAPSDPAAIETEEAGVEDRSISLAAMEAQLKPGVLAIFDAIAESHKKLARLQEQRINALLKGEPLPKVTERRYERLKGKVIEDVKRIRLNNTRIEHLVEQLYDVNRRLVAEEGAPAVARGKRRGQAPRVPAGIFGQRARQRLARTRRAIAGPRLGPARRGAPR